MKSPAALSLFAGAFLSGTAPPSSAGQPPAITRHPVPQVAMAGSSVTFIGATSDILATSLHWEKDGQPLPGANATTLVLRHLQAGDAGDYQFIAGNNRTVPGAPPLGESATRNARLTVISPSLSAGQLDQAFGDSVMEGMDARAVLALPDGGCLIAGEAAAGGRNLVRLSVTGTLDPAFSASGANARIRCLAAHGTGFLVGGDFATYAGRASPRLARLTAQGAVDLTFLPPVLSTNVRSLAVQRVAGEDRILAGLSGAPWLLRLRPDGTPDPTFLTPSLNGRVSCITLQADGRILIGGLFSASGNWPYNVIARLRSDGSPDTSGPQAFAPVTAGPGGAEVLTLAAQANGRILLGGNFTTIAGGKPFLPGPPPGQRHPGPALPTRSQ